MGWVKFDEKVLEVSGEMKFGFPRFGERFGDDFVKISVVKYSSIITHVATVNNYASNYTYLKSYPQSLASFDDESEEIL